MHQHTTLSELHYVGVEHQPSSCPLPSILAPVDTWQYSCFQRETQTLKSQQKIGQKLPPSSLHVASLVARAGSNQGYPLSLDKFAALEGSA